MATHSHAHSHAHGPGAHHHHHDHVHEVSQKRLKIVLLLTAAFMIVEFVGGLMANSLALMADSAHMLTDVGALGLSLFVLWFARRATTTTAKTYGYLRLEILAALLNGTVLIILSLLIFWQAYQRMRAPELIEGPLMLAVAVAGLIVNIVAAFLLHGSAEHNLNVRGAYLHVLGDLLGSVGAIVAAIAVITTGWVPADALISAVVGLLVLGGSWKLVRESVDVLLESVPRHIDLAEVRRAIDEIQGVNEVHDLHVWTLTSGFLAMSGHAVITHPEHNQRVLREINERLRERFGITHITVQIELATLHSLEHRA